jgi:hypothetical protein
VPKATDELIRKSVTLPAQLWVAVRDFRFSRRLESDADAVRRLLQSGLAAERHGVRAVPPARKSSGQR